MNEEVRSDVFQISIVVPEGSAPGQEITVDVPYDSVPARPKQPRGMLAGVAPEDMDQEQLKRYVTNTYSNLYKAKARGADEAYIAEKQAEYDKAISLYKPLRDKVKTERDAEKEAAKAEKEAAKAAEREAKKAEKEAAKAEKEAARAAKKEADKKAIEEASEI